MRDWIIGQPVIGPFEIKIEGSYVEPWVYTVDGMYGINNGIICELNGPDIKPVFKITVSTVGEDQIGIGQFLISDNECWKIEDSHGGIGVPPGVSEQIDRKNWKMIVSQPMWDSISNLIGLWVEQFLTKQSVSDLANPQ